MLSGEYNLPIVNGTLKSYLVLFVTKHMHVLQMFTPHTRAMGRFFDLIWYDLSVYWVAQKKKPSEGGRVFFFWATLYSQWVEVVVAPAN